MDLALIIQLLTGAVGGNLAGKLLSKFSMGPLWNSVLGILGGGLGGEVLEAVGLLSAGKSDIGSIIASIASGGVGGGILMVIVGFIKNLLKK